MAKKFSVIIEQDGDGVYIGRVPALKGCVTQGDTKEELIKNIKEAIELYLEVQKEDSNQSDHLSKFVGIQEVEVV